MYVCVFSRVIMVLKEAQCNIAHWHISIYKVNPKIRLAIKIKLSLLPHSFSLFSQCIVIQVPLKFLDKGIEPQVLLHDCSSWPIKLCTLGAVLSISFGTIFVHFVHVVMSINPFVSHPVKSDKVTHTSIYMHSFGCLKIFIITMLFDRNILSFSMKNFCTR